MIYLITSRSSEYNREELEEHGILIAKGKDFENWLDSYKGRTQLDTETNVVRDIYGWERNRKGKTGWSDPILDKEGNKIPVCRECYVVQIGDEEGIDQWIFDIPGLSGKKYKALISYLKSDKVKLIHNSLFDYSVIKWNFSVDINNIVDTYLMSQILVKGKEQQRGYHSLAGCADRYLGIDLSKAAQTSFNGSPMDVHQITYAAIDVVIVSKVHDAMVGEINRWGFENLFKLENSVVRSYGDAMCENFYLDKDKWRNNITSQQQQLDEVTTNLYSLIREYFEDKCKELGLIQKEDHYNFQWGSPRKKSSLMKIAYPELSTSCTTMPQYKKFLKDLLDDLDNDVERSNPDILQYYLDRNYEKMEELFITRYHKELDKLGIFTEKGTMLINFNSPSQTTQLFQLIDPKIESSGREVVEKLDHPIAKEFRKYSKASKLVSSYGENFFDWVSPDGQIRVSDFNQILDTGRTSMKLFQLLPQNNDYRNCFQPNDPKTGCRPDGHVWQMIGVDYSSQELCVVATISNEDKMLNAIKDGRDLHSVSASLLFPEEWAKLGGDPECMGKPKDPELLKFRGWSKAISFGLAYGMSAVGLGDQLDLPATTNDLMKLDPENTDLYMDSHQDEYELFCKEYKKGRKSKSAVKEFLKLEHENGNYLPDVVTADSLVQKFYNAYPNLRSYLLRKGEFSKQALHSRTDDIFGRIRFFDEPEFDSGWGVIERAGMNFAIQGSSANMTKLAIVYLKNYIEEHNLQDKLKFILPIHDEIQAMVRKDFAEEGMKIIIDCMEKAGKMILKNDLQKAEGEITDVWMK